MTRLTATEKRIVATLYDLVQAKGPRGNVIEPVQLATIRGSYKKQRGGIINQQTLDVSTAQVSFAVDYRETFMVTKEIHIGNQKFEVKDVTNIGFLNQTIIFDMELMAL